MSQRARVSGSLASAAGPDHENRHAPACCQQHKGGEMLGLLRPLPSLDLQLTVRCLQGVGSAPSAAMQSQVDCLSGFRR